MIFFVFVLVSYVMFTVQGQLEKLESEFANMKMAGFTPDVITYTSILNAYNGAGKSLSGVIFLLPILLT